MSKSLSSTTSLENLPTEIFQHICWLSLNPSLYLLNKSISSLLPSYSAYEHDLCLTIFIASPPHGAWDRVPPPRLFLTPSARAYPLTNLFHSSPDLRLEAQRQVLALPWLTLRKFHHHVLPLLARTWADVHWDGFLTTDPETRQKFAKFATNYYTEVVRIWDETPGERGQFVYDDKARSTTHTLDFWPRGFLIRPGHRHNHENNEHQQPHQNLSTTESDVLPIADLRYIPDWVLQHAGLKDTWTTAMSSLWIEDASAIRYNRLQTRNRPHSHKTNATNPAAPDFTATLLTQAAIRSLEHDETHDPHNYGEWVHGVVTRLWPTCADPTGADKGAVAVLVAAARLAQWKFIVRGISVGQCRDLDGELRGVVLPLVKAAEVGAVRNSEGQEASGRGGVRVYGQLRFIRMLRDLLESRYGQIVEGED